LVELLRADVTLKVCLLVDTSITEEVTEPLVSALEGPSSSEDEVGSAEEIGSLVADASSLEAGDSEGKRSEDERMEESDAGSDSVVVVSSLWAATKDARTVKNTRDLRMLLDCLLVNVQKEDPQTRLNETAYYIVLYHPLIGQLHAGSGSTIFIPVKHQKNGELGCFFLTRHKG
jgi:hypothetical protein